MVKVSRTRIVTAAILFLFVISCLTVNTAYAKYSNRYIADDSARVAGIKVTATTADFTEANNTKTVSFPVSGYRDFYFAIANSSEVSVDAELLVNNTAAPSYVGKVELFIGTSTIALSGTSFSLTDNATTNVKVRVHSADVITAQQTMKLSFRFEQKD